jgi:hypothetical protein
MTEFRKEFVSPSGVTYVARTAAEANDLQFGRGYKEASKGAPKKSETKAAEKAPPVKDSA